MDSKRVRALLAEAFAVTKDFPEHVQGHLAAAVYLSEIGGVPATLGADVTAPASPRPAAAPASDGELPATLGEFLADMGDLAHPQRVTAIAAFRFQSANVDSVTADEIRDAYSEVRASKPQNLSANIARCMKKGWIVEAMKDGKKAYRVTQKGLAQVREWRKSV